MALRRHSGLIAFVVAALDSCCALGAFLLASYAVAMLDGAISFRTVVGAHLPYYVLFVLVWCGAAADRHLLAFPRGESLKTQVLSVIRSAAIALAFSVFVVTFFTRSMAEREFLLVFGVTTLVGMVAYRVALRAALMAGRRRGFNFRRILLVGANERARRLVEIILSHGHYGYQVAGFVDDDPDRARHFDAEQIPYLGVCADIERLLTERVVDEVYIALPVRSFYETVQNIAYLCEGVGIPVRLAADLFPLRIARSHITHLEDMPMLSLSAVPEAHTRLLIKRTVDFAAASLALLCFGWWLFPIVALLVKLESRGPVFFKQERVGMNGRRFFIYKFRSMVQDAEKLRKEIEALNEADGPVFKIRRDPRVTRVGRFIRKTSIDELPQLLNVWLGHMSLVGPRPPLPSEVEQYTWEQRRRLSVRPGLTGLQQVSGRSDVSFQDWVAMDLAYIDEWSLITDLRIILRTVRVVLLGKGAA